MKVTFMSADLRLKIDSSRSEVLIFDFQDFTMPIITIIMSNLKKFLLIGTVSTGFFRLPVSLTLNYVGNYCQWIRCLGSVTNNGLR